MCGIASFLGNDTWRDPGPSGWLERCVAAAARDDRTDADRIETAITVAGLLEGSFAELMSFSTYFRLGQDEAFARTLEDLTRSLEQRLAEIEKMPVHKVTEHAAERLRDYGWQLRHEVIEHRARVERLLPDRAREIAHHYVAWGVELVLENIERLEVRGRDSAGLSIQLCLTQPATTALDAAQRERWSARTRYEPDLNNPILTQPNSGSDEVVAFVYKVASIIGSLGDNTEGLRRLIREDPVFWAVAGAAARLNVLAHTRWASNGIISIANCHPLDAAGPAPDDLDDPDRNALFVLNGDVDNCVAIRAELSQRITLDKRVTTDAKIPALMFRFATSTRAGIDDRFADLIAGCDGSLALAMQHPGEPTKLFLARKGAGQDLFVGEVRDGWIVASEAYGIVAQARGARSVAGPEFSGAQLTLSAEGGLSARNLGDRAALDLPLKSIDIYSRDIYRGKYRYYLLKELHESSRSIARTLHGKYEMTSAGAEFRDEGNDSFNPLMERLRSRSLPRIDKILLIGQGTASMAAMGIAHLIRSALGDSTVQVSWSKSSEVAGFRSGDSFATTLVIAISQSGTTTDTNRTVDLAASRGAWVHAIVNRRQSWLATHAHSRTCTSDGRDVEMAVASTKAYYSQVTAGKLLAVMLGAEYGKLSPAEVVSQLRELESLPDKVRAVMELEPTIAASAERFALRNANWAVVGNGPNKIAAEEIRIKLSELCYKSIPCDFTEDKKHIDLSTEPLTLVIANDLNDSLVSDTVKEVAIFRAHGGTPIVFCTRGESRFRPYAAECIDLPHIGANLGFVLATVAGHLWGFSAAKAIDEKAAPLRLMRAELTRHFEAGTPGDVPKLSAELDGVLDEIARGEINTGILPATVARLARLRASLGAEQKLVSREETHAAIVVLSEAVDGMTRPIDSIRHQAKTVTVGISRPQESLADGLRDAFRKFGVTLDDLALDVLGELRTISPLLAGVRGALLYATQPSLRGDQEQLLVLDRVGECVGKPSRYDSAQPAAGSKRTALRLKRIVWGDDAVTRKKFVIVPVMVTTAPGVNLQRLMLLHVDFLPSAPLPVKLTVLRGLGARFEELTELLDERSGPRLEDFVEAWSPAEIVTAPIAARAP